MKTPFVPILLLVLALPAAAATVVIDNGDRVSGDVVQIEGGKLELKTARMGEVTIDLAGVSSFESSQPVAAVLASGDLVIGTVASAGPGRVTFTSPSGSWQAAISDLKRMRPAPEIGSGDQAFKEALALFEAPDKSPWSGSVEFGGMFTSGNTHRKGFNVAAGAVRDTPDDRFEVTMHNYYSEENGERTTNEQFLAFREDLKFLPWYFFGILSGERDEFEKIDLRAILAPGFGRILADDDIFKAKAEIGPALTFVNYQDDYFTDPDESDSKYYLELRIGFHAEAKVFGDASVYEDLQIFPNLSESGEYRLVSDTGFAQPISKSLFFKLSMLNEINSLNESPTKRHDLKVLASLVFKF